MVSAHNVTVCSPVTNVKTIYAGTSQIQFLADGFFDDLQGTSGTVVRDKVVAVDAILGTQIFFDQSHKALNLLSSEVKLLQDGGASLAHIAI